VETPSADYPTFGQPAPPPRPSRPSRVRALLGHPQASAALLAILIGYASILSAVLAWRASLASIDASRHESLTVQQQARIGQIERELETLVAQDLRFVNVYQEHALAARELKSQADELRTSDPVAADELDLQSQAELDLARAVTPFFLGATGVTLGDDGTVAYDTEYVLGNLRAGDNELRELRSQNTEELATKADARSLGFIGVAAIIVAALLFLTIAQVIRTRGRVGHVFFAAGAVLVVFGTIGFIVVELVS
jgi:hypothetical protein